MWLRELFRRRVKKISLVNGRAAVALTCRVADANRIVSPMTGLSAALFRWKLLDQQTVHAAREGGAVDVRYRRLAMGLYESEELRLEVDERTIVVPLDTAQLRLIEDPEDGELVQRLPGELAGIADRLRPNGALAYRESFLQHGAAVRLEATLEELGKPGGYRASGRTTADFRALPDDLIRIEEL